ncbi:hypothetical protein HHUSO_G36586 [Huso huso]|uniref:Secreted protein n=1 Tax=Huso huso TaxID=61971 RepID=A0ABR0Y0R4_HUSHU
MDLFWILLLLWLFVIIDVKTVQELRSAGAHFFSALNQILTAGTHLHRAAIQLGEAVFQFCKAAAHLIGILFQLLKLIYHLIGVVVYLQDGPQDRILPELQRAVYQAVCHVCKAGHHALHSVTGLCRVLYPICEALERLYHSIFCLVLSPILLRESARRLWQDNVRVGAGAVRLLRLSDSGDPKSTNQRNNNSPSELTWVSKFNNYADTNQYSGKH